MRRTPLEPDHVAALRAIGGERHYAKGEMVARPGEPMDRFIDVEDGEIEVVDPYLGKRMFENTLGPTQFVGEIAFLGGGAFNVPFRAAQATRTTEVPRAAPNSDWLSDMVELDAKGFVRAGSVKRVASSVGEGSVVVSAIWALLEKAGAERTEADQQEPIAADKTLQARAAFATLPAAQGASDEAQGI